MFCVVLSVPHVVLSVFCYQWCVVCYQCHVLCYQCHVVLSLCCDISAMCCVISAIRCVISVMWCYQCCVLWYQCHVLCYQYQCHMLLFVTCLVPEMGVKSCVLLAGTLSVSQWLLWWTVSSPDILKKAFEKVLLAVPVRDPWVLVSDYCGGLFPPQTSWRRRLRKRPARATAPRSSWRAPYPWHRASPVHSTEPRCRPWRNCAWTF